MPKPEPETRKLVEDALQALRQPYSENVTDEVFEVIENDPELRAEYRAIADGFGRWKKVSTSASDIS